jgi:hypothetical protein
MKHSVYHTRPVLSIVIVAAMLFACSKSSPFVETDPATGQPPVVLAAAGGECLITRITQKNNNGVKADNVFEIKRDLALLPQNISSFDSLSNKAEYNIQLQRAGDTLKLSTGEYFIINKTTRLVDYFFTRSDLSDPNADTQIYQYMYNADGYLSKKYLFVNGSTSAQYETSYNYDNNFLLTGCILYAGSKKDKLLETVLTYDLTSAKKEWMYLFPDFFEGYHYLQALPFGKKGKYPVKDITTSIYDVTDGTITDKWSTTFSGYVFSQDGFILQTTAKGDLQQGLGLLFGTTRFEYQCSK